MSLNGSSQVVGPHFADMAPLLRPLIDRWADEAPGARFLSDARTDRIVGRRALVTAADAWLQELDARGVPEGARVLLDVDDPLAFAVTHLCVIAAGRCSAPIDPAAPSAEAARAHAVLAPALVLTDREHRITPAPDDPGTLLADGGPIDPVPVAPVPVETVLVDPGTGRPHRPVAARDDGPSARPGPGSVVLLTSGSTGAPKAVELTERQLLHVARAVTEHHGLTPADRGYCPLPLFHVNAQVVGLLATLVAGAELVLDRRFHRTGFWELLDARAVTWVNAVPAIITILADDPHPPVVAPGLRFIRSASAALPTAVRDRFEDRTGLPVVESYGMTEAASQITATPLSEPRRVGSVGRPVGIEVTVLDAAGRECPPGTIGRVHLRGPGVITGYVGGRDAGRFDAEGRLDTADLGHLDPDGFLHLAGRADDVVNRGGELVHPREIEEVLLAEPGVAEAVVVGRPDGVLGAVAVACVRPGAVDTGPVDPDDLLERLTQRCVRELAPFKRPAEIRLVEAFPLGPTGKVRRSVLRAELAGTVG